MSRNYVRCILFLCLLSLSTQAQIPNKAWLGDAESVPDQRTPLGIRYNSGGFDRIKEKRALKTSKWLLRRDVDPSLIAAFNAEHLIVAETMPLIFDRAKQTASDIFIACGGKWRDAALKLKPSDIFIEVMPDRFQALGQIVDGVAYNTGDVKLRVLDFWYDSKGMPVEVRTLERLALWEISNLIRMKAGDYSDGGSFSPCSH